MLKTNDSLQFVVLTGCLRVSKESIFTGLNNFKVLSITDARFDEQFGFTEEEVRKLLAFYHLESHLSEIKNWYDGYLLPVGCDRTCGSAHGRSESGAAALLDQYERK